MRRGIFGAFVSAAAESGTRFADVEGKAGEEEMQAGEDGESDEAVDLGHLEEEKQGSPGGGSEDEEGGDAKPDWQIVQFPFDAQAPIARLAGAADFIDEEPFVEFGGGPEEEKGQDEPGDPDGDKLEHYQEEAEHQESAEWLATDTLAIWAEPIQGADGKAEHAIDETLLADGFEEELLVIAVAWVEGQSGAEPAFGLGWLFEFIEKDGADAGVDEGVIGIQRKGVLEFGDALPGVFGGFLADAANLDGNIDNISVLRIERTSGEDVLFGGFPVIKDEFENGKFGMVIGLLRLQFDREAGVVAGFFPGLEFAVIAGEEIVGERFVGGIFLGELDMGAGFFRAI